jgi:hypothetical protein
MNTAQTVPGTEIVALPRASLAAIAPDYEAMRQAIAKCEKVDEIAQLADVAVAAQAYYRQSRDVENEIGASRVRVRAERRLGEVLKRMREMGERRGPGNPQLSSDATIGLPELGITRDRASRAEALASVPEEEFEAAMTGQHVAQPSRIVRGHKNGKDVTPKPPVPIEHTLDLWGAVRTFGQRLADEELPPLTLWRTNIQPFQIEELRRFIPPIIAYLAAIHEDIEHGST